MREHIHTVVGRYKGRIKGWDVVNEALDEDGSLRDSPWRRIIGDDYVAKAFEFAREADPNVELYYNDYSLENAPKRNGAVALIRSLQAQGIKVSGIGLQGHNKMDWPTLAQQDSTLAAFAALGINVMITELDVDVLPSENRNADVGLTIEARPELNPYPGSLPDSVQTALRPDTRTCSASTRGVATRSRESRSGASPTRTPGSITGRYVEGPLSVTIRSRGSAEAGVRGAPGRGAAESQVRPLADRPEEDAMRDAFTPVLKESLSDRLARRIRGIIRAAIISRETRPRPSWRWRGDSALGTPPVARRSRSSRPWAWWRFATDRACTSRVARKCSYSRALTIPVRFPRSCWSTSFVRECRWSCSRSLTP